MNTGPALRMDGPPPAGMSDITISTPLDRLNHPQGRVGGWLLFFILTLVFFGPAMCVFTFLGHYRHSMQLFARSHHSYSLYAFYFVEQLASFAVRGYGLFAGIQLWKMRLDAIQHAKRFLLILLLYAFLDYTTAIIWTVLMTPEAIRSSALSRVLYGPTATALLQTAFYAAIWYAYLLKSERVRVTFLMRTPLETSAATTSSPG